MKNDIIRFENNVPDNYLVGSRDYQALLRLFTFGISSIKFDVDNIRYVNDASHINSRLLNLLKLKVGFFTKEEFKDQYIREVLKVFSLIVKKKGTRQAIYDAINLYFRACRYNGDYVVEINNKDDIQPYMIRIGVTKESNDILLLEEILKYILPTGYLYEVFKYSTAKYKSNYYSQDILTLSVVDDYNGSNIHSNSSNVFIEKLYEGISVGPASIITITDGAENTPLKSAVVNIEPVQDLHGYDYPWPGGGRTNKLNANKATSKVESQITWTVNSDESIAVKGIASSQTDLYFYGGNGVYESLGVPTGTYTLTAFSSNATPSSGFQLLLVDNGGTVTGGNLYTTTVSYTVAIDSTKTYRLFLRVQNGTVVDKTLRLQLEIGSTATTWTPYSNICPISGWTQVKVTRAGANLLPLRSGSTTQNGQTFTPSNGTLVINGTATANSALYLKDSTIEGNKIYLPAGTYEVSGFEDYNDANTYVGVNVNSTSGAYTATSKSGNHTFTVEDGDYVFPRARIANGAVMANYILRPMIRRVSDASAFAPYQGTERTIPLGRTVYGGTLDVLAGEGGSVLGNATYDGTDSSGWTRTAAYGSVTRFDKSISGLKPASGNNLKCNQLKVGTIGTANLACCNVHGNSPVLQIQIPTSLLASDNVAGLMTYFQSNPLQVCYELATPLEYDVTPQTIKTLKGINSIWADAGEMSIEYLSETDGGSYITYYNVYNNVTDDYINILTYPSVDDIELYNGDFTVSISEADFDLDNANMYVLIHQYLKDDRIVCSNTTWSMSYDAQTDSITATSGNNEINISYSNFIRNLPLLEDHEIPSSFTLEYENESISTEGFVLQDDNRSFTFTGYDGNKIIVKYETDSQYLGKRIDNVVVYKNGWENESD